MTGLRTYRFETRTASRSVRGQLSRATAIFFASHRRGFEVFGANTITQATGLVPAERIGDLGPPGVGANGTPGGDRSFL